MGKHYSAEQWAVWVGEQRESELNVAEFCDWIGVSPNSFYRWRQKLTAKGRSPAGKGLTAERLSAEKESVSRGPELVPLTVLTSPVVEIDQPCGAVFRAPTPDTDRLVKRWRAVNVTIDALQAEQPPGSPS